MEKRLEGKRRDLLGEYLYQSTRENIGLDSVERWGWKKGRNLKNIEEENSPDLVIDWIHMTCQTSLLYTYIK